MLEHVIMDGLSDILVPDKTLKIYIAPTDEIFNRVAAQTLCDATAELIAAGIETPNLTLARGNTQTGIYKLISEDPEMIGVLSQARFFQLDEVLTTQRTFREFTEAEILRSIFDGDIPSDRWRYFDTSLAPDKACDAMRNELDWYEGLHIAFLGLGAEGDDHYAQVREGIAVTKDVIAPELSDGMLASYESYLGEDRVDGVEMPTHGLSLAHAAMPDNMIIAAKGANKALPVFNMLCENRQPNNAPEISTTFLRDLKNVTVILDSEAAEKVLKEDAYLPPRTEVFEYSQ